MTYAGQYLTYDEYQEIGGLLDEAPFNLLEFEARKNIDDATMGRLKGLASQTEEVKLCIYKLILLLDSYEKQGNKNIASESIDGYSVSYGNLTQKQKDIELLDIIKKYLGESRLPNGIPYLYRG